MFSIILTTNSAVDPYYIPTKQMFAGVSLGSACLSVFVYLCPSVYKILVSVRGLVKVLTHYQMTNFRLFKLKEFADDNFKFDENSKKLSKWVENTVGKGEIARYEQFLLFPQCFKKACPPGVSKGIIVWEWVQ